VRAYDVRSGKLRCPFHPFPIEVTVVMTPGRKTWKNARRANNWAGMVVDRRTDRVRPHWICGVDFYGADPSAEDLFANSDESL